MSTNVNNISITNIPYGSRASSAKSEYEATKVIVSDGTVDAAFVSPGETFISSIIDSRVQQFLADGKAPADNWKPHELGGFDSENQSLFVEKGRVVLRSNIEEKGTEIKHLIKAPFEAGTGVVDLEASTEGYVFAPTGSSASFKIPLG